MPLAKQPSALPTNKLAVGSTVTAIVGTQLAPALEEIWPALAPAILAGPAVTQLVAALAAMLAGMFVAWWVPDRPNEVSE
jgi:hypothetical protein